METCGDDITLLMAYSTDNAGEIHKSFPGAGGVSLLESEGDTRQ